MRRSGRLTCDVTGFELRPTEGAHVMSHITAETRLYDNSLGSRLLFEARAGALRTLVYKQRFDNNVQSTVCRVCEGESETSEHIILRCGGIRPSATSPTEEANRLHHGE